MRPKSADHHEGARRGVLTGSAARVTIEFDGQRIETSSYRNKEHLREIAPDIYDKVKETVFWESGPMMAQTMANFSGTVVRGDIRRATCV